ncbi:MAG: hypothetical protein L0Y79_12610 [Chlorobi bacterium]|nr:hypothetical protein [Chlorobiota bacterium]MCI0715520.1 hypothetical protein [Chlorobiota bacterium]
MFSLKNIKLTSPLIALVFVLGFGPCSENDLPDNYRGVNLAELEDVSETDFAESDEDILTVDYKEFYDELAPHGEWIEVTDKDVGLDLKKGSASGENSAHRTIGFSQLFGVEEAYADDVSFGAFFVWRPSPNLAVSVVAGEPAYIPYTAGRWVYTDLGWYYMAPTPYEEIVHHYGRWVYSPTLGWIWVPGRVWAPAWVEWRVHAGFIAWTPIPPSVYIVNSVVIIPPVYPVYTERYVIVEDRYFCEPTIYKYIYKGKDKIVINQWSRIDGLTVVNKTLINKGPDVIAIEKHWGKIDMVKINKIKDKGSIKYSEKEFKVYSPDFKKVKSGDKIKNLDRTVNKPRDFAKFEKTDFSGKDKSFEREKRAGKDNLKNNEQRKGDNIKSNDRNKGSEKNYDRRSKNDEELSKGKNRQDGNRNIKKMRKERGNDRNKGNDNNYKDNRKNTDKNKSDRNKGERKFEKERKSKDMKYDNQRREKNDKQKFDKQRNDNKKFRNNQSGNEKNKRDVRFDSRKNNENKTDGNKKFINERNRNDKKNETVRKNNDKTYNDKTYNNEKSTRDKRNSTGDKEKGNSNRKKR